MSKDSDALSEVLSRLFGVKAGVLENVIAEVLLTRLGVPAEKRKVSDFRSLVRIARAKFISSGSNVALTSP
ncbi:hypothetical protein J2P12_07255 [Candidatus Bathyarchaeota archaeon]|nr:hypothetical protein [Candidatus Bathyarchaeota archaeon]